MNTIAVLHKVKKQKLALITRSILHGNSITQKSHLIYWLKNKNFKYFVVENIRPETKENHLQNIYRLEKDVISLMKRCNKREYLKDYRNQTGRIKEVNPNGYKRLCFG